ncbi:hypoxia up-regulated protein 1 isoform X1 [Patella vulgata]|uniref:hypoxia up-regulated protein 1 isoform X1 n=1 Tax=Patella vulgata TaxID=6465 RepID=UPI00217F56E9|nr:hypoxia up-regulated protein 1 isoform X1 [Patella vulgata]
MTKYKGFLPLVVTGILIATLIHYSDGLAVMSVDFGSEYMKIAIVKPGVPMEIVLNKESSRKTRTIVAFRDGERHFSNMAHTTGIKFPQKAYWYLLNLVGKRFDDPHVELYRQRFPYYNIIKDEDRGTLLFQHDDETTYTPEELLAMVLENARDSAEAFAEQSIKDAVITVPAFFHQAERRALLTAADMIGLNVLQLMSDNAAVALNYGVFRRKNFNSTMQYYMFYDMGASSTVATIAGYHIVKIKEGTRLETNPQVVIKGVGFDRTLGGLEITVRLRDHLAKLFNDMKKTKTDVRTNQRSMAKLLKEADRVKHVLSANADHFAQVEGLLEEKDFRAKVTRAELEEMSADLFDRVAKPIEDALRTSEITMGEINEVILMGAGTRMPKIQDKIMEVVKRKELGKSINTDEAAALGAVYQAAYLGKGFKVKTFSVKEANLYPIVVDFEKHTKGDDGVEITRNVKRTLFGRMNPFPQKKVMTFNKHFEDFSFSVNYGDLDFLSEEEKKLIPSLNLTSVTLQGVKDAHDKHGKDAESKGVKAHFRMDESGVLSLDRVESVFEKLEVAEDKKDESTWSKLGTAIGGLFGGGEKEKSDQVETVEQSDESATNSTADNSTKTNSTSSKPDNSTNNSNSKEQSANNTPKDSTKSTEQVSDEEQKPDTEAPKEETQTEEKPNEEKKDDTKTEEKSEKKNKKKKNKSDKNDKKDNNGKTDEKNGKKDDKKDSKDDKNGSKEKNETKTEEEKKPKNVIYKEDIVATAVIKDLPELTGEKKNKSQKRLKELRKLDLEKVELEKAKNSLESYIFDMQDKMSQEDYMTCSTTEEQENMSKLFSESSDWLYETPEDTKKEEYKSKLKTLKDGMKDILIRFKEREERPKALDALFNMLNHSNYFLATIKNLSSLEDPVFTEIEITTLEKLVNETKTWRDENVAEQKKLKDNENPKLLVESIAYKIQALDREVKYLVNKAKTFKPKIKPKVTINDTKTGNNTKKEKSVNSTTEDTDTTPTTEKPPTQEEEPPVTESAEDIPVQDNTDTSNTDDTSEETQSKNIADEGDKPSELDDGTAESNTPRTDL